jgi:hypothetical protein
MAFFQYRRWFKSAKLHDLLEIFKDRKAYFLKVLLKVKELTAAGALKKPQKPLSQVLQKNAASCEQECKITEVI